MKRNKNVKALNLYTLTTEPKRDRIENRHKNTRKVH